MRLGCVVYMIRITNTNHRISTGLCKSNYTEFIFVAISKAKLKTFKFLSMFLSLVIVLSACNLSVAPGMPTQTISQNLTGFVVVKTLQDGNARTQTAAVMPTYDMPKGPASPVSTPFPPNTPVWSIYTYTCEFSVGGGTMTMELNWDDRSESEEGYTVYRDEQAIATLAPNSTYYVDVAFVATGKTLSYFVEAFNTEWQASSSTITYGCQ
jgi:hypothetical protein